MVLLPLSTTFATGPKSDFDGGTSGIRLEKTEFGESALGRDIRFARSNYVWPYATGPYYGNVDRDVRGQKGVVHTSVGTFRLDGGLPQLPSELKSANRLGQKGVQYFVVALEPDASLGEVREDVNAHGGAVMRAVPVSSMIARLTPAAHAQLQGRRDVIAIEPYHAAFKLEPSIGRIALLDPVKAVSDVYDLDIRIFAGENAKAIAAQIQRIGGNVIVTYPDTVRAEIHRSKLGELAAIEGVYRVFEHLPVIPFGEETTTAIQTGALNGGPSTGAVPYHDAGIDGGGGGIDGSGQGGFPATAQVLMVLDTGIQLDAGDLSDTSTAAGTAGPLHRKVRFYGTTTPFGTGAPLGDLVGCDAGAKGGFTHGHVVSAVALGAATRVDGAYGEPWFLKDNNGNPWRADGVAPGAVLVAYDGQLTPAQTSCADPLQNTVLPGDLYSRPASGSMHEAYATYAARIFNFSWGREALEYDTNAMDIDQFLVDHPDAMVFVAAGNSGVDLDNNFAPDEGTLSTPATAKNILSIGSTRAVNDLGPCANGAQANSCNEESRTPFSSVGPAPGNRVAPQLMAPGSDTGTTGIASEFACLTADNDQMDPVECSRRSGLASTSFSSAAAAGAAMLVRDYFAQGFHPDGRSSNPGNGADQVANISGSLVKSVLIASADFLDGIGIVGQRQFGDNVSKRYRFNNEQGYGRIQLDNALPLSNWPLAPSGLLVADGGIASGVNDLPALDGTINAVAGGTDTATFTVCDPNQELRVALTWIDDDGQALVNNLNLEVESPTNALYYGNYFTDDNDRDGLLDDGEDCPSINGETNTLSENKWSLAVQPSGGSPCPNAIRDTQNPTEGVFLSPDPLGNDSGDFSQIESGEWTIRVIAPGGGTNTNTNLRYTVAIAGGVCKGSAVSLDRQQYVCNGQATITVNEVGEAGDATPTATDVSNRTSVQVLDGASVVDEESGLTFTAVDSSLTFESATLVLTDSTVPTFGNGVLDVRSGNSIRVLYKDVGSNGLPDTNKERQSIAAVDCVTKIGFGNIVFVQHGNDTSFLVQGGCELNARGLFGQPALPFTTRGYGAPDRYMDSEETLTFNLAFASQEPEDLRDVTLDLRCFIADGDSPEECRPGSTDCADPDRLNNASCDQRPSGNPGDTKYMTVYNTPQFFGLIPAFQSLGVNFAVQMESFSGTPEVEMILSVKADNSGKTASGLAISRQNLNVDESSLYYSTDFPGGGVEFTDWNSDEVMSGHLGAGPTPTAPDGSTPGAEPVLNFGDNYFDYRFEAITWSDLTVGGKNLALNAPWNFDVNDGNFKTGLSAAADEATIADPIAQWGEDKNFNGDDDSRCTNDITKACQRDDDCPGAQVNSCQSVEQRDPDDGTLDKSWNTRGGCGWVTRAPGSCEAPLQTQGCYDDEDCPGELLCNLNAPKGTGGAWHTGRIGGTTQTACLFDGDNPGQCQSMEIVSGATGQRVWFELLATPVIQKVNGADFTAQILDFQWNQLIDLPDDNAVWTWEVDNDTASLEPVDLFVDLAVLNGLRGDFGAIGGGNNPELTDGYTLFADLCEERAPNNRTPSRVGDCLVPSPTDTSVNGTLGNNRIAKNSCFFENAGIAGNSAVLNALGLPGPPDNDVDDDLDTFIDEFVTPAGPYRNMNLNAVNGPDMRNTTLEDFLGGAPTGETFQAAIGIRNEEKDGPNEPDPAVGFGLAVDDVELRWREFNLVEDQTDCGATGECAVIDLVSGSLFEGRTLLTITVLDKTPDAVNDCDLDGNPDPVPTNDCDNNGVRDVVVRATSPTEIAGEIVILNATGNPNQYRGDLPVSTVVDIPGVLFITQVGLANAVATVFYDDNDFDGMGNPCPNNATPAFQGTVQASTTFFIETGDILVIDAALADNGDNDGFADTNETVSMRIRVRNRGSAAITGLRARLASNDPKIDCIIGPDIFIGDVPPAGEVLSTESFVFRVANVDRAALGLTDLDPFAAELSIILRSDQFDVPSEPQTLTLDLDLDASGGGTATTYLESFEQDTLAATSFNADNIDSGRNNETNSDGYRCQYHDPANPQSNSFDVITNCFLAQTGAQADAFFWQIHRPDAIDGGRAFSGTRSLYMGIFGAEPDEHTTPMATLEAVNSDPINLGVAGAAPELSFKHQVSLLDSRSVNAPDFRSADRAVVMLQLADPGTGAPVGDWIKLRPFVNVYDQQAVDNFFQCTFDPIDDGTTEDDLFDPGAPGRPYGPSSTCFTGGAAFDSIFAQVGDTFRPFNLNNLGFASDGPGLAGSLGIGTWVESKVSLFRFKGRRARLRFLSTALKVSQETWEQQFTFNPDPGDDGWWIDDVQVTNTLTTPATVLRDEKPNTGLEQCGEVCNTVTAVCATDPATSTAPGQVVEISAIDSFADRCLDGVLQCQFWIDGDFNGQPGGGADTLLRSWTDNCEIVQAPRLTTTYIVEVRCSNKQDCRDLALCEQQVPCPLGPGQQQGVGLVRMGPGKSTLAWTNSATYDYARGALPMAPPYTTLELLTSQGPAAARNIGTTTPAPGAGWWYLLRNSGTLGTGTPGACNDPVITWTNAEGKNPARDANLP